MRALLFAALAAVACNVVTPGADGGPAFELGDSGFVVDPDGGWSGPTTVAACAFPAVDGGHGVTLLDGGALHGLEIARLDRDGDGGEEAVLYAEGFDGGRFTILLQRLTSEGISLGAAVLLGASSAAPTLALAAGPGGYLGCWDHADGGIDCAALGLDGGLSRLAPQAGSQPTLAYGSAGFVSTFAGGPKPGQVAVALPQGGVVSLGVPAGAVAALCATESGYAGAFGGGPDAGDIQIVRLDAKGQPEGPSLDLPNSGSVSRLALAASGDELLCVFADPISNAPTAVTVDPGGALGAQLILGSPGDTTFGDTAAAGGVGSFAATWSSFSGAILYRAILLDGTLLGLPIRAATTGWDDNQNALVAVSNGLLLVASTGGTATELTATHLACP